MVIKYNSTRSRRAVLASIACTAVAGCTESQNSGETPPETASETATDTDEIDENFYIENRSSSQANISVTVSGSEETYISDTFSVPGSTGIIFESVIAESDTYDVTASLSSTSTSTDVTANWGVSSCEGSEAPKGNRDGGVQYMDDDLRFRQNNCDVVYVGTARFEYNRPDDHRV